MSSEKIGWTMLTSSAGIFTLIGAIINAGFNRWNAKTGANAQLKQVDVQLKAVDVQEGELNVKRKHLEVDQDEERRLQMEANFEQLKSNFEELRISSAALKLQLEGNTSTIGSLGAQVSAQQSQITALVADNSKLQKLRNSTLSRCRQLEKQVDLLQQENVASRKKIGDLEHLLEIRTSPAVTGVDNV